MSTAWLGLGSNVDAERNIRSGIDALNAAFENLRLSPVYRSASVGFDGDDFLNLVASVETTLSPRQLKDWLNALEDRHDRRRDVPKFSDRTLDVDILLYDDIVTHDNGLEIPRAEVLKFAHVLRPLADLDPDLVHPEDGRSIGEIWRSFDAAGAELVAVTLSVSR